MNNKPSYKCTYCDAIFSFNGKCLAKHIKNHEEGTTKIYQCDVPDCGKILCSNSSLNYHRNTHNKKRGKYTCCYDDCDVHFSTKYNKRLHELRHEKKEENEKKPLTLPPTFHRCDKPKYIVYQHSGRTITRCVGLYSTYQEVIDHLETSMNKITKPMLKALHNNTQSGGGRLAKTLIMQQLPERPYCYQNRMRKTISFN